MTHSSVAYKVLTSDEMAALAKDCFEGAVVDIADGYIHLSTAEQVTETIERYFAGQSGIWLVSVNLGSVKDIVKWEPSRGGELFPHIYGALKQEAVAAACPLRFGPDGNPLLPMQA